MADIINSLNSSAGSFNYNGAKPLSSSTKAKLEALGIDTTSVTTEAQGQALLKVALQSKKKAVPQSHQSKSNVKDPQMQASEAHLSKGMDALASYNKIYMNLK